MRLQKQKTLHHGVVEAFVSDAHAFASHVLYGRVVDEDGDTFSNGFLFVRTSRRKSLMSCKVGGGLQSENHP